MVRLKAYRIALAISLIVNALLLTGIWFYSSIEGLLSIVATAVGFVD